MILRASKVKFGVHRVEIRGHLRTGNHKWSVLLAMLPIMLFCGPVPKILIGASVAVWSLLQARGRSYLLEGSRPSLRLAEHMEVALHELAWTLQPDQLTMVGTRPDAQSLSIRCRTREDAARLYQWIRKNSNAKLVDEDRYSAQRDNSPPPCSHASFTYPVSERTPVVSGVQGLLIVLSIAALGRFLPLALTIMLGLGVAIAWIAAERRNTANLRRAEGRLTVEQGFLVARGQETQRLVARGSTVSRHGDSIRVEDRNGTSMSFEGEAAELNRLQDFLSRVTASER